MRFRELIQETTAAGAVAAVPGNVGDMQTRTDGNGKKKRKKKKKKKVDELDIWKPDEDDTMGVPRGRMPQIDEQDYPEFFEYLKKNNVSLDKDRVDAKSLNPIQKEFTDQGVLKALAKEEKPVIASSDNFIVDGHHRWLASINTKSDLPIYRANITGEKLFKLVKKFPKTYFKEIY